MPLKVEPQKTTSQPSITSTKSSGFVSSSSYRSLWDATNFATVALATSTGVIAVHSPLRTVISSLSKNDVFMPAYKGGFLGCVRMLYAGTRASFGASSIRSVYVTGTKSTKIDPLKEELGKEEALTKTHSKIPFIASAAFGEVVVIQIPSSLADYRKTNIIPADFKWWTPYNLTQLMKGNFGVKYCSSLVGCYSMCVIEPKYAEDFSLVPSHMARFMSGALSGVTAAVINYPIASFIDYTQVRTQVIDEKLVNKSALSSLKDLNKLFWVDPRASVLAFFFECGKTTSCQSDFFCCCFFHGFRNRKCFGSRAFAGSSSFSIHSSNWT